MSNSQSANKNEENEEEKEERTFSSTDSNRGYVVALAVREACKIACIGSNHQDWDAACKFILNNKLLTDKEKNAIVNLLHGK
jgi:hypothetical protein